MARTDRGGKGGGDGGSGLPGSVRSGLVDGAARQIEGRHWQLWGWYARQGWGDGLGYPGQWHWSPPPGYREHSERDEIGHADPVDDALACAIGIAVEVLAVEMPQSAKALKVWWRAFPGARDTVEANARRMRVSRSYVYDAHKSARSWVEAWVDARRSMVA